MSFPIKILYILLFLLGAVCVAYHIFLELIIPNYT